MSCAACGHDNRAGAKFCDQCGVTLAHSGAAPAVRAPGDYTPRHLAERILTERAALQGERKAVTVLFADVQGSLALAEQVDAEEWHGVMNQFFAILSAGVHRFEGTVNQYTGDGIMALFGAPLAHEHHAQRACHAALHLTGTLREYAQTLRRERGLQFSVRMGLNSGEVVVGAIGDDLRMDYTAQGHTVGLASRMEQLCEPGRVYLTDETARLAAGYFELEDLGLFTIKGVSGPLRVWAMLGPGRLRTRFDVARARGLSQFIGRADELAVLDAALADAGAGQPALVSVVAEAGVGKSRLCLEFAERCRARGATVIETQALAHGAVVPYLPVLSLFRRLLAVDERDTADAARQKIAGALLLLDDALKPVVPLVFDLLGVPDTSRSVPATDAGARQSRLLDTCAALLRARARRQPAVLLIEDLHWLDGGSDAFIHRLLPALADAPVLPVLNFRPEYDHAWLHGPAYRQIALQPLADADGSALLAELLGRDPSLGDLAEHLGTRAAGNPFFVEELVQSLVQSGALSGARGAYRLARTVDAAAIPTSVQALLAARMDRLAARDKEVLQTAAVIGKQFGADVLRAVSQLPNTDIEGALQSLAAAELLVERADSPGEYAFKHPLTQEVAYTTQLATRRAQLHAAVARALVAADAASNERAALIAYHWEKGGAAWDAAQWQHRTARGLVGTDTREAVDRLRQVLRLLETLPQSPPVITLALETQNDLIRIGTLAGRAREEAERLFTAGRAVAERTDNRALLLRLLSTYGEFLMMRGQSAEAQARLAEASALAADIDDDLAQIGAAIDRAQSVFWTGRLRETLTHIDAARRRLARGQPKTTPIPVGLMGETFVTALHGLCLSMMGRPRDGAAELERVVQLADEEDSLEGRSIARQFRAIAALTAGELSVAAAHAQTAAELATRAANPFMQQMASSCLGYAYVYLGRLDEAVRLLAPLVDDESTASVLGMLRWFMLSALAEARRRQGDLEAALAIATRAVELAGASGALTAECNAQFVLATTLAGIQGSAAENAVEEALTRAEHLITESGAESFRPRWHLARAECARLLGDAVGAEREMRAALRVCKQMGMGEFAGDIARELASAGGAGGG